MSATFRWTWPMSTPGSIGRASPAAGAPSAPGSGIVEGLVDELVGVGVLGSLHVADRPTVEVGEHALGLGMELFHVRVFHFVAAFDLPHDQLRVADQLDLLGAVGG